MALITNNISGSTSNLSQIGITGSVIIANRSPATFPAFPGTDVTFFVSGSTGVPEGKSVFGGDLVISGSGQFFGNVLEVSGAINLSGTMDIDGVFRSGYSTFSVNDYTHVEGSVTFAADVYSVITFVDTGLNEITVEDAWKFSIGDKVAYVYNASSNNNQVYVTEVTNSDGFTIVTVASTVSVMGSAFHSLSNPVFGGISVLINLSQINQNRTFAHAEGSYTIAAGLNAHAEGRKTAAIGDHSHAEGVVTLAAGDGSHAEGRLTTASGDYSHAEGNNAVASGISSHAEGGDTIASGYCSHAEGQLTVASADYTHTEGQNTAATGNWSHAEGNSNIAGGNYAHAEGNGTSAIGQGSHAEGEITQALGGQSHAEGYLSIAYSDLSHAEGHQSFAGSLGYVSFSISGGVVTISGYGDISSQFIVGSYLLLDDRYGDNIYTHAAFKIASIAAGDPTIITLEDTAVATTFAIIGAQGNEAPLNADATFGHQSHAEGYQAYAQGLTSHAEGETSKAIGWASHAEGLSSIARGKGSHSEGNSTANGEYSHAEGHYTVASGTYSHAGGDHTIASGSAQTVVGKYNLRNNNFSLFVVGNGTGDVNGLRSDAIRVNAESTQVSGSFFQRNSGSSAVGFMGSDLVALPTNKGPDVFFYVSGTIGAKENAVVGTALFGGDVVVSGSLFAEGDTFEVTGSLTVTNGISGSLTKLSNGASYLVAGANITITSQSNGQITITASGGGGGASLQFLAGTVSSQAPSSSMESIGMDYLDTTSLPPTPTYTFSAILATTAGTTAYVDLYDYDGIIGGTPNPVAGAVLTGSSTSYTYLTADVTSALSLAGSPGILEARIWCSPTGSGLNAICKSAKLTIS